MVKADNSDSKSYAVNEIYVLDGGSGSFLVDTGATTHIVNKDVGFINYDESFDPKEHHIELADGSRTNNVAKKRGTLTINLRTINGDVISATLNDVTGE